MAAASSWVNSARSGAGAGVAFGRGTEAAGTAADMRDCSSDANSINQSPNGFNAHKSCQAAKTRRTQPTMIFDPLSAIAAFASICALVASILVLRALTSPAQSEEAEMLQRLGVLVERDQQARMGELEAARVRLAELERVLIGRVEQNRHDMSERL